VLLPLVSIAVEQGAVYLGAGITCDFCALGCPAAGDRGKGWLHGISARACAQTPQDLLPLAQLRRLHGISACARAQTLPVHKPTFRIGRYYVGTKGMTSCARRILRFAAEWSLA
jgi:hypothetical protein